MNQAEEKISRLIAQVTEICPQLADCWQATAVIESLGYTDGIIEKEFGFANALSLGKYVYEHYQPLLPKLLTPTPISLTKQVWQEVIVFLDRYSRSFVYTLPLIVVLLLGSKEFQEQIQLFPPQLASLFTLATLASLITSGGFVQMISRRGLFYLGLGEKQQARRVYLSLLYLGLITIIVCGFLGLLFGFYRNLFTDEYLIIGLIYYVLISLLWMLLAILSLELTWGTQLILLGITSLFLFFRLRVDLDSLVAQLLVMILALIFSIIILVIKFRQTKIVIHQSVVLPRLSATIYLLTPYFSYGIFYFSFIFLDRLVAGWSISSATGLIFAIDSDYQKAMDLALLNFLLIVPLGEYLSYRFIRFWFELIKQKNPSQLKLCSQLLKSRYLAIALLTGMVFILSVILTLMIFIPLQTDVNSTTTLIGCIGYLFFVLALVNAIILFSLNQAKTVIKTFIPALIVNAVVGYSLANAIAIDNAAVGLLSGAIVLMVLSTKKVLAAIKQADYFYYLAGY